MVGQIAVERHWPWPPFASPLRRPLKYPLGSVQGKKTPFSYLCAFNAGPLLTQHTHTHTHLFRASRNANNVSPHLEKRWAGVGQDAAAAYKTMPPWKITISCPLGEAVKVGGESVKQSIDIYWGRICPRETCSYTTCLRQTKKPKKKTKVDQDFSVCTSVKLV